MGFILITGDPFDLLTDLENLEKEKIETFLQIENYYSTDDVRSCPFYVMSEYCMSVSRQVSEIKQNYANMGYDVEDRYFSARFDALKKAIREIDQNSGALSYEAYILKNNSF